ncbi:MAG: nuclear transport factor 2 family protein [Candidatus Thorarchaeota archaeon]|jgi:ketosteroid isomerase-like protein
MSVEDNIRLVNTTLEAFEAHDMDGFVSFMSESVVNYAPGRSEPLIGREAVREDNIGFLTMYPDVVFEITRIFGDGEMVCAEGYVKGTNTGPIPSPDGKISPPTNKSVRVPACFVVKIENGLISEIREYLDQLEFSRQLGTLG